MSPSKQTRQPSAATWASSRNAIRRHARSYFEHGEALLPRTTPSKDSQSPLSQGSVRWLDQCDSAMRLKVMTGAKLREYFAPQPRPNSVENRGRSLATAPAVDSSVVA